MNNLAEDFKDRQMNPDKYLKLKMEKKAALKKQMHVEKKAENARKKLELKEVKKKMQAEQLERERVEGLKENGHDAFWPLGRRKDPESESEASDDTETDESDADDAEMEDEEEREARRQTIERREKRKEKRERKRARDLRRVEEALRMGSADLRGASAEDNARHRAESVAQLISLL
jgi:hypothetical protein